MTPEEAGELLDFGASLERRRRRYMLEGGQRRAWQCDSGCGWKTEAETVDEAQANLRSCPTGPCSHQNVHDTRIFMPPLDFS